MSYTVAFRPGEAVHVHTEKELNDVLRNNAKVALALAFRWVARQASKEEAAEMVHWAIGELPSLMPTAEEVFLEAEVMDREDG